MNKPLVLVVEDDRPIRNLIVTTLKAHDYHYLTAENGHSAIIEATSHNPDIVLLDLGLPDIDGTQVIESIRSWSNMPIIVISARSEDKDKITALDAGADDYVTKPFRLGELLARVRALLRRSGGEITEESDLTAQDVRIEVSAHRAFQGTRELQLTAKEFELLRVLVREAGAVVEREAIMREVWGGDPSGSTKTLDMHVSWLRRKLGDDANNPHYITTVRGMGFRFETA